ncbi:MAG: septum formation protein Maf [Anaerolineae bacterium]|nr:septum formation protein Maf [Anaerolineae bacterium]
MPAQREQLVLASTSPRRRELLALLGIPFVVCPAAVPEDPLPGEPPGDMVVRLSASKARYVARERPERFVVGSDTSVSLFDAGGWRIFGKPTSRGDARRMLSELEGREHAVHTGYAVLDRNRGLMWRGYQEARVRLRHLEPAQMDAYVASGVADDKAGAYAVQDKEQRLVDRLDGCAAAVMGLPLCALRNVLLKLGLPVADISRVSEGCSRLTGQECCLSSSAGCPAWVEYAEETG